MLASCIQMLRGHGVASLSGWDKWHVMILHILLWEQAKELLPRLDLPLTLGYQTEQCTGHHSLLQLNESYYEKKMVH